MAQNVGERKLPPLEFSVDEATFRPTLFVGIGQTATTVLRHLKRRLTERLGDGEHRYAMRILCLDTDTRELGNATAGIGADRLDHEEILALPLKSPGEYREAAESHFTWLSRRWIYNIPRSRQTEGLRPLGRLAFVDHHDKVFDRLHSVIGKMTEPDAVSRTASRCDMRVGDSSPKVFVVASISGGAGSGMVADLAYTIRMVLAERGLDDYPVHGILLYSTSRSSTRRDITVANTYCCLSELYHYSHMGGYPGDPSCDLPAFDDCPTFDNTYLINMGSDPLADEYTAMADVLAEYLFLDAATPCGQYFNACRDDNLLIDGGMCLRTLGLSHSGGIDGDAVTVSAKVVCDSVLRNWLKPAEGVRDTEHAGEALLRVLAEAGLNSDQLVTRFRDALAERCEGDPSILVQQSLRPFCLAESPGSYESRTPALLQDVEDAVDNALGIGRHKRTTSFNVCVKSIAEKIADEVGKQISLPITTHVLKQLDRTGHRIGLAEEVHREVIRAIDQVAERVAAQQLEIREQLQSLVWRIEHGEPSDRGSATKGEEKEDCLAEVIEQYGHLRVEDFCSGYVRRAVAQIRDQLDRLTQNLVSIRQQVAQLADECEKQYCREERYRLPDPTSTHSIVSSLYLESTMNDIDKLVAQLDATVQGQYFEPGGGFRNSQEERGDEWRSDVVQVLYRQARGLIAAKCQLINFDATLDKYRVSDEQIAQWVGESLKLARPNLLVSCGGRSRLVVALPRGCQGKKLESTLSTRSVDHAKLLPVTDGDVAFCYEVGGIPIHQLAAVLLQSCPRSADIISRVHTAHRRQVDTADPTRLGLPAMPGRSGVNRSSMLRPRAPGGSRSDLRRADHLVVLPHRTPHIARFEPAQGPSGEGRGGPNEVLWPRLQSPWQYLLQWSCGPSPGEIAGASRRVPVGRQVPIANTALPDRSGRPHEQSRPGSGRALPCAHGP